MINKAELFNKYEEAIKMLKQEKRFAEEHGSYYGDDSGYFDLAISALEKQIPKKPITEMKTDYRVSHKFRYCSNCKDILEPVTVNHCSTCGQKLDWSEVQE